MGPVLQCSSSNSPKEKDKEENSVENEVRRSGEGGERQKVMLSPVPGCARGHLLQL